MAELLLPLPGILFPIPLIMVGTSRELYPAIKDHTYSFAKSALVHREHSVEHSSLHDKQFENLGNIPMLEFTLIKPKLPANISINTKAKVPPINAGVI